MEIHVILNFPTPGLFSDSPRVIPMKGITYPFWNLANT